MYAIIVKLQFNTIIVFNYHLSDKWKYLSIYMTQAQKSGYGIDEMAHTWMLDTKDWGCWRMHRQVSMTLFHMCKIFPTGIRKQMIVMSLGGHCHYAYVKGWGLYKGSVHEPQGYHLGFWLLYIQFYLVRSHHPSVVATSVPLKEWDYNFTGKCSLFV